MARDGLERQIGLLHPFMRASHGLTHDPKSDRLSRSSDAGETHVRDRWILVALAFGVSA
jgi:hypothetical protein